MSPSPSPFPYLHVPFRPPFSLFSLQTHTHTATQINTQPIPPISPLLSALPSGREIHTLKPYIPPCLDTSVLQAMRAPPSPDISNFLNADTIGQDSSDDEDASKEKVVVGAFPGTREEYVAGDGRAYY